MHIRIAIACWFSLAFGASAQADAGQRALSAEQRQVFWSSPEDPPVEHLGGATALLEGKHYLAGNEWALDAFIPALRGLGGGYIGVGSDQAYLFIGWMEPELAWLIDYDLLVVQLHDVYLAFFGAASDRQQFLSLWKSRSTAQAVAVLEAAYSGAQLANAKAIYKQSRAGVERRLTRLAARHKTDGIGSYLTSDAQYEIVASRVRDGRVRRMSGNLLDVRALRGIAETARKLSVPIRAIYFSNAEEYWSKHGYTDAFRANVRSLPFDERSIVLRTLSTWPENRDYRYVAQPAHNFVDWLARPWFRSVFQLTPRTARSAEAIAEQMFPYTFLSRDPDTSGAARRAARRSDGGEPRPIARWSAAQRLRPPTPRSESRSDGSYSPR